MLLLLDGVKWAHDSIQIFKSRHGRSDEIRELETEMICSCNAMYNIFKILIGTFRGATTFQFPELLAVAHTVKGIISKEDYI